MKKLAALALALSLLACRTAPRAASSATSESAVAVKTPAAVREPIHLTFMGTNDTHGWIEARTTTLPSGQTFRWGGMALLSSYAKKVRASNPGGVVLLDAGDLFQGTLPSNFTEGAAVVDAFNALGYTAAAVGNHEFDYGPEGAAVMATQPGENPFGALIARIHQAHFPILSANIYDAATGQRPEWLAKDGTLLINVKGVKVGILGLTTPQTPFTTNPANVSTLRFAPLVTEALAAAKRLREQGAEVVVGLMHAGGRCEKVTAPEDLSTCDQEHGEVFQLLNALPEHTLDVVIAGHVHRRLGNYVRGTPVISTSGMGKSFGLIDVFVDPDTRKIVRSQIHAQIPLCLQTDERGSCDAGDLADHPEAKAQPAFFLDGPVTSDPEMEAVLKPHLDRVRDMQNRPLGIDVPRALVRNYEEESGLGDVLADSFRLMEKADLGLMNSGGLRADVAEGPLTYGRVYEVMPFDNTVATLTLTGEELMKLLEAAYSARKGVYQVSGLRVTLSQCAGPGRLKKVTLDSGKPLNLKRRYRVVMPDFLARGGDGLGPVVAKLPPEQVDLGERRPLNLRDTVVAYWRKAGKPLVAPVRNRIRFLNDQAKCPAPAVPGVPASSGHPSAPSSP